MFLNHSQITPARLSEVLSAAEAAARAIPPAFPLDATVAVNPFLGQTGEDLATASARLARVAGTRITQTGEAYAAAIRDGHIEEGDLEAALDANTSALKHTSVAALKLAASALGATPPAPALPTIADLAAKASGIDWPSVIDKTFGMWAAGHFDRGQALWSPTPGAEAFAAWRAWASHDLTPEIAGLKGFCAHVTAAPDTTERAILFAADRLGLEGDAAETAFHRLFMSLGGWAQHARWILWQAELAGEADQTIADLLAIRLIWEEALLEQFPQVADEWADTLAGHAAPVEPTQDQVTLAILQDAADRAHQRRLTAALDGADTLEGRPELQAAFCIDVRSEVFRRALESVDSSIETVGFAGFFGLPIAHRPHGSDLIQNRLPVLLNAGMETTSEGDPQADEDTRIKARTARAFGRFKQAAVSSFAFVESMGPFYAAKLVTDALGVGKGKVWEAQNAEPMPQVVGGLTAKMKADTAAAVLGGMSM
ncbi:MAG: putative inorganic carbon transporter subunit DabA, partial [Pseudomonadota bacterium]